MKTLNRFGTALSLAFLIALGAGARAHAADGAVAKTPTIWNSLGIPQGIHKIQDALINPRGNHPKWERKPALKQIADPANQESPNPVIKAAAKAKADADLAPQKIKAIKYLATLCCGCAKNKAEIKAALMAALDDCTEEVRYQAALALCQCAGDPCTTCNGGSCCDANIMNKLLKVSEGKDAQGCWEEPSARVRAVAANALSACQQVHRPTAAKGEVPRKGEVPPFEPEAAPGGEKTPEPKKLKLPTSTEPSDSSTGDAEGVTPTGYVEIRDGQPARPAQDGRSAKPAQLRPLRPSATSTPEVRFQGRIVPSSRQ